MDPITVDPHRHKPPVWFGVVAIAVVATLGTWWIVSSKMNTPLFVPLFAVATSTPKVAPVTPAARPVEAKNLDVVSIIKNISGTARFSKLLISTGVGAQLSGKGPYTVFVPTDGAFSLIPQGEFSKLSPAQLARLAKYHVVSGTVLDPDAVKSGSMPALSGDALNFGVGPDQTTRVGNAIIIQSYKASNGIVYTIAGVLFPPLGK